MEEKELKLAEVFSGQQMDAGFVKSLLENAEIKAFLKDDNMGTIAPWHVSAGGAGAVKVIVNNQDYEAAKSIVDEFETTRK